MARHGCTPGGIKLIEGSGAHLRELLGFGAGFVAPNSSVPHVRIIASAKARTVDTANALARGWCKGQPDICMDQLTIRLAPDLLKAEKSPGGLCSSGKATPDPSEIMATTASRLTSIPMPDHPHRALKLLQRALGVGRAGNLTTLPEIRIRFIKK